MRTRRFIQCDVFSPEPVRGNALAVVVDGAGLSDVEMQRFAAWTNLAETTFLLPPSDASADYRVRIWTPTREMLFAGHPTLGSCAAWLHCGGVPREPGVVRQECGVGVVDVDISAAQYAFVAPPTRIDEMDLDTRSAILDVLEIPETSVVTSAQLSNGPVFQMFELTSAEAVLAVDSSRVRWPTFKAIGLFGPFAHESDCDFEIRHVAPSSGMSEDPITGSMNAALAHWLQAQGRLERPVTVAQGTVIDRYGRVSIVPDGDRVLVGGDTHILIDGEVTL
ncbi:MAG: PhzF family phenazine biosynthesis protein [Pseudomonadota bacterium]